ncbi:hypothetical protein [Pseudonocardia spinosispora]|uniref:hypothetical protein n=1 Tax=Pseudonocardia spinosispora TaxID=103441 RepID=UPI00316ADD41
MCSLGQLQVAELVRMVREQISAVASLRDIAVVPALPRTRSGRSSAQPYAASRTEEKNPCPRPSTTQAFWRHSAPSWTGGRPDEDDSVRRHPRIAPRRCEKRARGPPSTLDRAVAPSHVQDLRPTGHLVPRPGHVHRIARQHARRRPVGHLAEFLPTADNPRSHGDLQHRPPALADRSRATAASGWTRTTGRSA